MRFLLFCVFSFCLNQFTAAQPAKEELTALSKLYAPLAFELFHEILSIPNDAHYPDHVARNVDWMTQAFRQRNFTTQVLDTGGPPLLLAERKISDAAKTVLIYLQIDGQPVDTSAWHQESPYDPVLKEQSGQIGTAFHGAGSTGR